MSTPIRAVTRALDVLLCFTQDKPELTLSEIAELVELHKSTVLRVLCTLESKRFVQRDEATGKYRLGLRVLELAMFVLEHIDLRRQAWPFLYRLAETHRETVDLGVLDDCDVVYLEVIESPQRVKLAAAPGQRLPAYCTSSGKAILAYLPDEEVRRILDCGTRPYTSRTIVSADQLLAELQQTRERGFAIAQEEFEDGINAVAAPVLDRNGAPVAVVALAGPAYRLSLDRMLELGPSVRSTADAIAREIGVASALFSGAALPGIAKQLQE